MAGVELATAWVNLVPTTRGLGANLEKELTGPLNAAAKKAGDEAGKTMKRSLDDVGQSFTKFGVGALAVAGVVGAGLFKAGKSASSLGESINAVQVTFGKSAAGILKLGENAADSLNLSNVAFNSLAVQFSNFAKTIAGSGGDVVGTMKDLTGRAADFASVMDIDVREAATLFQSGLAGETEPLRRYGIDLSAAAVKAFAAANGIGTLGKELTEGEKVQARYALIMEKTSATQDDLANTAGSAANQMRHAGAVAEDASASLGEVMAPAIGFAAGKAAELAGALVSLNDATGGWLAKGAGIATLALGAAGAVSLVVGQVIKFRGALTTMKGALTTTEGGLTRMSQGAKVAGVALGVAAIAAYSLAKNAQADAESLADVAEAATELSRATDDQVMFLLGRAMLQGHLAGQDLAQTMALVAHTSIEGAKRALELAEAAGVEEKVLVALRRAIVDEERASKQAAVTTTEHGEAIDEVTVSADAAAIGTDVLKLATDGLARAADEAKRKSDAFADSLVRQREKTEELFGIERSAVDRKYAFAESTRRAGEDLAALNETLKHHKEGTEEATAATDAAKASILKASEDYATLKGASLDSEGGIRRQIDALTLQAAALAPGSPLRLFLEQYIQDLKTIPSNVATALDLHVSMTGQVISAGGDIIGSRKVHARGGYTEGGWAMYGEEGPELAELPRGSFIHTAAATRSLMASSMAGVGGAVPPIVLNNYRRDIGVADLNQVLAMARLAS